MKIPVAACSARDEVLRSPERAYGLSLEPNTVAFETPMDSRILEFR